METRYGRPPSDPHKRFYEKIRKNTLGCWVWQDRLTTGGYGQIFTDGKYVLAHRWAYENIGGVPIPPGYQIDHLCRNRACVNPEHLQHVTPADNIKRGETGKNAGQYNAIKTHCKRGHEYTPDNTIITKRQGRFGTSEMRSCKACKILLQRQRRAMLK